MPSNVLIQQFLEQLDVILIAYREYDARSQYDILMGNVDRVIVQDVIVRSKAAIERISGPESVYSKQARDVLNRTNENDWGKVSRIVGVVSSLKKDLEAGYLTSLTELIHGEVFGNFLEMADHLQDEGYKDAAAVITSGTLEAHLKQLCIKNGIDTELNTSKGVQPKKADQMNADLTKSAVYSKLDQKNVTAWLDLRNKAAHGNYAEYTKEQVTLLIASIRDFITRNPA